MSHDSSRPVFFWKTGHCDPFWLAQEINTGGSGRITWEVSREQSLQEGCLRHVEKYHV